jgi:hypothetical protein
VHPRGETNKKYFAREILKDFFAGVKAKVAYFAVGKNLFTLVFMICAANTRLYLCFYDFYIHMIFIILTLSCERYMKKWRCHFGSKTISMRSIHGE